MIEEKIPVPILGETLVPAVVSLINMTVPMVIKFITTKLQKWDSGRDQVSEGSFHALGFLHVASCMVLRCKYYCPNGHIDASAYPC